MSLLPAVFKNANAVHTEKQNTNSGKMEELFQQQQKPLQVKARGKKFNSLIKIQITIGKYSLFYDFSAKCSKWEMCVCVFTVHCSRQHALTCFHASANAE